LDELELDEDELELDEEELELDEDEPDDELEDELDEDKLDEDKLELDDVELPGWGVTFTKNTRLPNPPHLTSKNTTPTFLVMVSPMNVKTCLPPCALSSSQTNDPASFATLKLTELNTT